MYHFLIYLILYTKRKKKKIEIMNIYIKKWYNLNKEVNDMNKFYENFKIFMSHYKIKQSILVIKTGYEKNKLSRLLSGKQQLKVNDMQALSKAVGKSVDFFMSEMNLDKGILCNDNEIAFSAGVPTPEKTDYANKLFDLLENIDFILGMEKKISQCNMNEV